MTITISRLYDNYSAAQQVVNDLEAAGLRSNDISIVANNRDDPAVTDRHGEPAPARRPGQPPEH